MNIMDENLKRKKNLRIGFVEDRRKKKKIMGCIHGIYLDLKDSLAQKAAQKLGFQEPWTWWGEEAAGRSGLPHMEGAKVRAGVGFV